MASNWLNNPLLKMTPEKQREIDKKLFGFETFDGILCDASIKGCKRRIKELEERYPSNFVLDQLKAERAELAKWEEFAKQPFVY